ncbi:Monodehydroascorbate reductase [Capsicum baccatum]|uniref:Monodehydroascorbate reductase n=1 Tax=Capsicum baccatum TaxID=33114 RepID=A0A2G2W581_CAPBA|nr:Monodehydroascorbate reductase [Capsicum baccatum]
MCALEVEERNNFPNDMQRKLSNFGVQGADSRKIFYLREINDTAMIMEALKANKNTKAIVVRGGYVGLELTVVLRLNNIKVDMVYPELFCNKTAKKILIDGAHADDPGCQCGVWIVTWTGLSGRITVGVQNEEREEENDEDIDLRIITIGLSMAKVVENHHHSSTYGDGLDNHHSNCCNRPIAMPTYGKLAEPLR